MLTRFRLFSIAAAALSLTAIFLPALISSRAEILPVKTYTAADGLPRDAVFKVRQDSRGLMWFCTDEGVARFDGYEFKVYSTEDGLPSDTLFDVIQTKQGAYWLATGKGLVRFNPQGNRVPLSSNGQQPRMFITSTPDDLTQNAENRNRINVLAESEDGKLWIGSTHGLYWVEANDEQARWRKFDLPVPNQKKPLWIKSLLADRNGGLWVAAEQQILAGYLYHLNATGKVEMYQLSNRSPNALLESSDGTMWVGFSTGADWRSVGLCKLNPTPQDGKNLFGECYRKQNGLPADWITTLCQTADGKIWAGTMNGLATLNVEKNAFETVTSQQGLPASEITDLREDRDGNLWVTSVGGMTKIVRGGFVRYAKEDGLLAGLNAVSIFNDRQNRLIVATSQNRNLVLNLFDGQRFMPINVNSPPGTNFGWGTGQMIVNSRAGDWWIPTEEGVLYRFRNLTDVRNLAVAKPQTYSAKEGFTDKMVWRMYEDGQGSLWVATNYHDKLLRLDSGAKSLQDIGNTLNVNSASSFVEDGKGTLWIASTRQGESCLIRVENGRSEILTPQHGWPHSWVPALHLDQKGRLWLTTLQEGLGRIDDPYAERLTINWYTRGNGLSKNRLSSLAEDKWGRIYIGTGRGVDCLTPETGQTRTFTTADGLPKGEIYVSAQDHQGALWFGSEHGVARFVPEPPKPNQPPTVFLSALRVAGVPQQVSEIGDLTLPELKLNSSQTNLTIDFLSPSATSDPHIRYQYKLEGRQDWSAPTDQRSVDFANLSAGSYRFQVRAVNADGVESATPASVSFTVAAPVWQRWWFILLTVGAIGGLAYAAYRYRVAHLLALDRMRTRIATDLHDEVGSSLSQIAILSEVVRQKLRSGKNAAAENPDASDPIDKIAATSRGAIDAMSEIVWLANPLRDHLSDLSQRMRLFASDTLTALDIRLRFHAPEQDLNLDAEVRREVFLIFKEAINNIARHSDATEVEVEFTLTDHHLSLRIKDNGHGFAEPKPQPGQNGGNGLLSMKRRAAELGGNLEVISGNGSGTTIQLEAPLRPGKL